MTPAARIQAAIEILEGLNATAMPADRFIRDWFRARRYAGSKDRAAVSQRVARSFVSCPSTRSRISKARVVP